VAVTAKFQADFSAFTDAVNKAEVKLREFETGSGKVEKALGRLAVSFSGEKVIKEANLMVKVIGDIENVSKLTDAELKRVNATVTEAVAKYAALGQTAPKAVLDVEAATKKLLTTTESVKQPTNIFANSISDLEERGKRSSGVMDVLTGTFGKFTLAGVAVSALNKLGGEMTAFVDRGTKLGPVEQSFERLSAAVQQDSGLMLSSLQTATRGMVSNYDLMLASNKAVLLGLPVTADSMQELAKTATVLGKAMGQDATKSFDDLITALGRTSPMILDNLGITVKLEEANAKYAASVGKSADSLTEAEKKTAFYLEAMNKARERTVQLGEQTKTLGEIITTVWTKAGNIVSKAISVINEEGGRFISQSAEAASNATTFLGRVWEGGIRGALAMSYVNDQMAMVAKAANHVKPTVAAVEDFATKAARLQKELLQLNEDQKKNIASGKLLGATNAEIAVGLQKVSGAIKVTEEHLNLMDALTRRSTRSKKDQAQAEKEILESLRKSGEAREKTQQTLLMANKALDDSVKKNQELAYVISATIPEYANWRQEIEHVEAAINRMVPGLGAMNDKLAKQQEEISKFLGMAKQAFQKELEKGLDFGKRLADNIIGAFQGGGDIAKSIGAFLGNEIGKELGESLAKKLASVLGEKIGGAIGGLLGPLGAIGGSLIGGLFDKMFSKAGRDAVEAFAEQFGGFDSLRTELNALGAEGERLWVNLTQRVSRGNVQQAESAIKAIEKALEAHKSAVSKAEQESAAATQKATDAHKAAIDQVKARISDLDSEYNSLYNTIKNEAPEDEMGIIERNTRAEMDRIRRERETAQTELERITGAMEDSFERVADAAERAAEQMIEAFGQVGIRTPGSTSFEVPELATGGIVKRPTLALIGEKGPEAVVPLDSWRDSGEVVGDHTTVITLDGEVLFRHVERRMNQKYRSRTSVSAV
jgi:hypothetical protein